jgi:gas vesicle protein
LLVGALAGSAAMLLFAPQSGEKTRNQIRQKSIELTNQATEAVEDAMAQTRNKVNQITMSVQDQVDSIRQRGQDVQEVLSQ